MLVEEIMTAAPLHVRRDATVHSTLQLLAAHGITALPVVDHHTRVVGVVSEADLLRERVAPDPRAHELPLADAPEPPRLVEDVMTPMAVTVEARTEFSVAVDIMTSTALKSLPVVDRERRLVGVVSRSDVVRALARPDAAVRDDIETMLAALGHADWLVEVAEGMVAIEGPRDHREAGVAQAVAGAVRGVVRTRVEQHVSPL